AGGDQMGDIVGDPYASQHWMYFSAEVNRVWNTMLSAAPEPLATQSEEPVAWAEVYSGRAVSVSMSEGRHHVVPLYLAPPATRPEAEIRNEGIEMAARPIEEWHEDDGH